MMEWRLRAALDGLTVEQLKWYARLLLETVPIRKPELIAAIEEKLRDPDEMRRLWTALSPTEQQVVAEAVHALRGRYDAEVLQAKYASASAPRVPEGYGHSAFYSTGTRPTPATAYDLLFFAEGGRLIHGDVASLLRPLAPPPAPMRLRGLDAPPRAAPDPKRARDPPVLLAETEPAVFHDLAATLVAVQQGKIGVGTTRLPTLAGVRHLRERLLLGEYLDEYDYERADDAVRPLALVVLVQAAGWAAPAGPKGGRLELTKSGRALLTGSVGAADVRHAWERWLASDLLDELSRVRAIKGQRSDRARLTKPAERREKLAAVLRACPVGRWVETDELFRYMRARRLGPALERTEYSALYVGYSMDSGWLGYYEGDYWEVVIGTYLRAALWEYVATLGLVDIAYTPPEDSPRRFRRLYTLDEEYLSRYDGLLGLRLTALGAYALGRRDEYSPPAASAEAERPSLKVLPNLDVVVTDAEGLTPLDRALLEQACERSAENVYRLSRDRLLGATELGVSVEQVGQLLARKSGGTEEELPQTVRVFLADVERGAGILREAGRWIALESDDPYLLTELANSPSMRTMVRLATAGEKTVLLVLEAREEAARRQLKKLGYVPRKS